MDGLDATARSFIVMTYITVLGMVNALDQMFANALRDFLVEAAPILTAPSFSVAPLVPRTRRAAGVIAYSSACRERQLDLTQESVLTGFTTLVTLLAATTTALLKSRELIARTDSVTTLKKRLTQSRVRNVTIWKNALTKWNKASAGPGMKLAVRTAW